MLEAAGYRVHIAESLEDDRPLCCGRTFLAAGMPEKAREEATRLLDMGMDPFNFADALLGILAQRLAKRMCGCKQAYTPEPAEITAFLREYCEELMNTSRFKAGPKGAMEAVYKEWVKTYGNEIGRAHV